MTAAEEIKAKNSCRSVLLGRGFTITSGHGANDHCLCPFHQDRKPSLDISKVSDIWICRAGCGGGDVIDLLAKLDGKTASEWLKTLSKNATQSNGNGPRRDLDREKVSTPTKPLFDDPFFEPKKEPVAAAKIVAVYSYHDANGNYLYEAIRYEPKDFRQRVKKPDGSYSWSMENIERVLYHLPEVRKAAEVWIVEGEKDADMLRHLGLCGTCNVGGAKKWLDGYSEFLAGKDVIICGDNDTPGQEHATMVQKSIESVAKTVRVVRLPRGTKDISDHTEGMSDSEALAACVALRDSVEPLYHGEALPLLSMEELEREYERKIHRDFATCLHMGRWLPALAEAQIVPGELVCIIAETGVGKTSILTNIGLSHPHLKTLYFHLELSERKAFERTLQTGVGISRSKIRERYMNHERIDFTGAGFDHVLFCTETVTLAKMASIIRRSELRFGDKPALVLIDYVQLMKGEGKQSRYERFTDIAEGLKSLAKELNVVIVIASQVSRGDKDKPRAFGRMNITDAKDSGAIENSAALMLGASRNPAAANEMCVQVLKGTEIGGSLRILCNYNFETLRVSQVRPMRMDE